MKKKCNNSNLKDVSRIFGRAGFTLAEVLITLAIVGVVAALTLPNLIANYKKKSDVVKLKKAYTTLQQAFRRSEVDNGPSEFWDDAHVIGATAYFEKYWKPYFNNPMLCQTYQECGYESIAPYKSMLGQKEGYAVVGPSDESTRVTFYLPDGTLYLIFVVQGEPSSRSANNEIFIDVNGGKLPNTFGRDVFVFERVEGKGILPYAYDSSKLFMDEQCLRSGRTCARKIMSEGWEMNY